MKNMIKVLYFATAVSFFADLISFHSEFLRRLFISIMFVGSTALPEKSIRSISKFTILHVIFMTQKAQTLIS